MNVSVVIPSFNRGERIRPTLDALLHSDVRGIEPVEIVVIDDGSDVAPEAIISSYNPLGTLFSVCANPTEAPRQPVTRDSAVLQGRSYCSLTTMWFSLLICSSIISNFIAVIPGP